tara:strand:+ start:116 stop:550 length:435 start_codon:yes stop_codon:yes gene_type:complete
MANIKDVQDKVQRMLSKNFQTQLNSSGGWAVFHGSTGVMIRCQEMGDDDNDPIAVSFRALVLKEVPITPELTLEIACTDYRFGGLSLWPDEDGSTGMLWFHTTLLGDFIDEEEVICAVINIAGTADDMDDELKARFGGKTAFEN